MTLSSRYRQLGDSLSAQVSSEEPEELKVEEARLEAYEGGYQAGWDDATEAHRRDSDRVLSELAQTLEDMSFTYQEAHGKIMLALKPMMTQLVAQMLPKLADQGLQALLLEQISELADGSTDQAVELAVAPSAASPLAAVLKDRIDLPFAITTEETLTGGQAYVRIGRRERQIDLDAVMAAAAKAFEAFFDTFKEHQVDD